MLPGSVIMEDSLSLSLLVGLAKQGGIAQWLERRTRDWNWGQSSRVRIPPGAAGKFSSPMVDCLCWLLFRYPFHHRVTAVARKKSRSKSARSARGSLHWANDTHTPYVCGFAWSDMVHGCMMYTETRRDGSSFMWLQPCQRCMYTTSVDIQKRAIKS